jgi:hypothetical protein
VWYTWQPTPRSKGLLKTPGSTSKQRSVVFVDDRGGELNEVAYLASASNDPDFVPGIIRMPTPGRPTPGKPAPTVPASPSPGASASKAPSSASKIAAPTLPAPPAPPAAAAAASARKRGTEEADRSPSGAASKRRKIGSPAKAATAIVQAAGGACYVQLGAGAPVLDDIEDYFLAAANSLFADILANTAKSPIVHPAAASASKGSAAKASPKGVKASPKGSAGKDPMEVDSAVSSGPEAVCVSLSLLTSHLSKRDQLRTTHRSPSTDNRDFFYRHPETVPG